ncbi:hypothetical protein [Ureaplasma ceti]|uniref:Lipoprotein n=1 Tax=Ureaplasma ceti TaxID=3119530 RepID=A0ABP9U7X6_9BACT
MKINKKTKYWLIGGIAAAATMITIPLLTTSCSMVGDLAPAEYGPYKTIPTTMTADVLVHKFKNQTVEAKYVPCVQYWSFEYSLAHEKTLKGILLGYINDNLGFKSSRKNHFYWSPSWLKNLKLEIAPIKEKQEYKLTLSLMSGPNLSITTAHDPLYLVGFQNNEVSSETQNQNNQYLSLYK